MAETDPLGKLGGADVYEYAAKYSRAQVPSSGEKC